MHVQMPCARRNSGVLHGDYARVKCIMKMHAKMRVRMHVRLLAGAVIVGTLMRRGPLHAAAHATAAEQAGVVATRSEATAPVTTTE